jgi:hypothetical protein
MVTSNHTMTGQIFRVRTQWPLLLLFLYLLLSGTWSLVSTLRGAPTSTFKFVLSVLSLVLVCPLAIFFFQSLQLTESHLIIRTGPFRRRIAVHDIRSVRSVDWMGDAIKSSKAAIAIRYGAGETIRIAPVEHDVFLGELLLRNPQIVRM